MIRILRRTISSPQGPVSPGVDFHSCNRERGILKEAVHSWVTMGHKLNLSSTPPLPSLPGWESKRKENIIIGNSTVHPLTNSCSWALVLETILDGNCPDFSATYFLSNISAALLGTPACSISFLFLLYTTVLCILKMNYLFIITVQISLLISLSSLLPPFPLQRSLN